MRGSNEERTLLWLWKQGHIGKNCPDKKKPTSVPKKMNRKELYAHIQSLTAEMDEEEKEKFYEEAEKEGF